MNARHTYRETSRKEQSQKNLNKKLILRITCYSPSRVTESIARDCHQRVFTRTSEASSNMFSQAKLITRPTLSDVVNVILLFLHTINTFPSCCSVCHQIPNFIRVLMRNVIVKRHGVVWGETIFCTPSRMPPSYYIELGIVGSYH